MNQRPAGPPGGAGVIWCRPMAFWSRRERPGPCPSCDAQLDIGLAKRGLKGLPTVAVKTPDDLPAAIALIENS